MSKSLLLFGLLGLLFFGCTGGDSNQSSLFKPGKGPKPTITATTKFVRLDPGKSGIDFVQDITETFGYSFINDPYVYNGGGVAVIDFDNDGLQDLYFSSRQKSCKLYRNLGNLRFEDVTEKAGVAAPQGLKAGVVAVDINGDGFEDLYLCRTGLSPNPDRQNILFINQGDGTFKDQASEYGVADISPSQCANFLDYDLDGDLDLYVVNQPVDNKNINNPDFLPGPGKTVRTIPPRLVHDTDRFFRNEGNGKFTDISQEAGIWNRAWGLSVTSADFNQDGYPDLFVGNDFIMPDFLYINDQKGGFRDEGDEWFRHTSNHTMGVDIADLNNDGLLDVVAADMLAESWMRRKQLMTTMLSGRYKVLVDKGYGHQAMRNTLQINNGNGSFSEVGCLAGMFATDWSWATLLADFDNDGWKDLFVSNGIKRDLNNMDFLFYDVDSINRSGGISEARYGTFENFVQHMPSESVHNYMYQNTGSLCLQDVSEVWGLGDAHSSNGAVYADLDNDGDLDLVANAVGEEAAVYENKAVQDFNNNWLQIKCNGPSGNPGGTGAKIRVVDGDWIFYQEMTPYRGFYSSVEAIIQLGLGERSLVESVEIEWPGNTYQKLENVQAGQRLTLDYSDAREGSLPPLPVKEPEVQFESMPAPDFTHRENSFEDFDREQLITHRMSRIGPCTVAGDANGDGLDDVFVGGARGQAGIILIQQKNGGFTSVKQPAFLADSGMEDVGGTWFDADGDGDLDLFVVSGGNEAADGDSSYVDRLYLNNGNGLLERASNQLPAISSSTQAVLAEDVDGDGDTDLLVGGRCKPGSFPFTSDGIFFENIDGQFQNATDTKASDFKQIGMVTGLRAEDLDGDGTKEIIASGEWMPVSVLRWKEGKLVQSTEEFGLGDTGGWWYTLETGDLDGDGDVDLIAGNLGLNSRYYASVAAPMRVFAKDFDGNGSIDPLVTVAYNGKFVPTIMRDHWATQVGAGNVRKKFPRHAPWAEAGITDVWPKDVLKEGYIRSIHTLASSWFENVDGRFVQHDLPPEAQVAPVFAVVLEDYNGDGKSDLLLLGNDQGMEVETASMDASNGTLLINRGGGKWEYIPNRLHGLWAHGEIRSAAVLKSGSEKLLVLGTNNGPLSIWSWK